MASRYELVAEGTSAGLLFLVAPVAGYFLGKWGAAWLGLGNVPAYAGALLGLAAAFFNLLRLIARISK